MDQPIEFLVRAKQEAVAFAQLRVEYGISRQTGYEWRRRPEGEEAAGTPGAAGGVAAGVGH